MLWDRRTGDPVRRAIVWQSRQTTAVCERLRAAGHEPLFHERTGLVLDPYFSGSKIAWLLEADAALRARAEAGEIAFGTIDSWVIHRLTGGRVHATDPTNASRTLLYDIHERRFDPELLEDPRRARGDAAFGAPERVGLRRDKRPRGPAGRNPDRGRRGRPAGGALRPGLLRGRHGQEHLRHRRVPGVEHRHAPRRSAAAGCSPRCAATRAAAQPTRSKARCSWRARRSSGCATSSGS